MRLTRKPEVSLSDIILHTIQNALWRMEKLFPLTINPAGKRGPSLGSHHYRRMLFLCIRRKFLDIRIPRTFLLACFFLGVHLELLSYAICQ